MGQSTESLKIALIGAGNVATHLGLALSRAGHNILYVYSRTQDSASTLSTRLGCKYTTDIDEASCLTDGCDIVIFSVKDSALESLASRMPLRSSALFLHTAGSMPISALPMEHCGVLYPMQTFSKERETDFSHIPTFLEVKEAEDKDLLESLARSITSSIYWLKSEQRKSLHLSAVFTCNFTNYCYDIASQLLEKEGLPFSIMLPLIEETTRKLHQLSPFEAQTGPAVRYDTNVINRHLQMLHDEPDNQKLYSLMSQMIHTRHEQ